MTQARMKSESKLEAEYMGRPSCDGAASAVETGALAESMVSAVIAFGPRSAQKWCEWEVVDAASTRAYRNTCAIRTKHRNDVSKHARWWSWRGEKRPVGNCDTIVKELTDVQRS